MAKIIVGRDAKGFSFIARFSMSICCFISVVFEARCASISSRTEGPDMELSLSSAIFIWRGILLDCDEIGQVGAKPRAEMARARIRVSRSILCS
eukprot:CAMPEP_0194081804 /NCGR_PEP_ID=MMETSP0149-20130528/7490_1 /TAXON_ID=122233 /ORGANISM="Chaetoceros debilis, Strain MM31A-1" /LENGTH=93 /DNA_ID=CAMNT_0038763797 /DNA_START=410 /DNA_END=691 /DNA_ORIENTATION=-